MNDNGFQSRSIEQTQGSSRVRPAALKRVSVRGGSAMLAKTYGWIMKPRTRGQRWQLLFRTVLGLIIAGIVFLGILWITLPNINDPATMFTSQSTVILDRNGIELYRLFSEQDRTYVHGDEISQRVKDATIAIEDERFLSRSTCFDVVGILRAGMSHIVPGFLVRSGGSTLTQQFAKNALVGRDRTLIRKIRELMLACELERRYDKTELLELYLNWIPFGHNAYGIEQASKNYFNTSAKDLTLAQSAVLAAMLQRPSYFNPYGSHLKTKVAEEATIAIMTGKIQKAADIPDDAIRIGLIGAKAGSGSSFVYVGGRADQVLKNMLDQKSVTLDDYNAAIGDLQKLTFKPDRENIRAPHFVLGIQKEVEETLSIDETVMQQGGFRITTTLDWNLQQIAEKIVTAHKEDAMKRFGAHNTALVALAPKTREVLAYVGNSDFSDNEHEGKIDMAVSPRQPGSSFKAFTYLAAFEAGYGPGSAIYDVPTKFGTDEPANFDGTFWGLTSMRQALGGSRNIPAIKAFFLAGGEEKVLGVAERLGVVTPTALRAEYRKTNPDFDYGWPLSIGAAETPLIEMVQGYAGIADGGVYRPIKKILKITDKDGNIRYLPKDTPPVQVIDERLTAEVTSVLSDITARPDNQYWKDILTVPGFAAAAKTGTSNKCLERTPKGECKLRRPESTWTMGFTPNLIAGVWVGNATSQSLFEKADGLTTAAPIWHDFMTEANRKIPGAVTSFTMPGRLSHPLISRLSGKLASPCTPEHLQSTDIFLDENVPSEEDPACALLKVDKVTHLLSSPACPSEAVGEETFFLPESELPDRWPLWEQGVQDWVTKQIALWDASEDHSGSLLPLPIAPTKTCDPLLTPGRDIKPELKIISPASGETVAYPVLRPKLRIKSGSAVKKITFDIDGQTIAEFTSPTSDERPVRVPRSVEATGTHELRVTITDTYYNTATDSVRFSFDGTADTSAASSSSSSSAALTSSARSSAASSKMSSSSSRTSAASSLSSSN